MDSRLRGNDGGDQRRNGGNPWLLFPFSMIILRHSRVGGNPWLLFPFSMITLRHSCEGGSMVAVPVLHENTASFPRRRESIVAVLVLHDNTASFPRRRESMVAVPVLHDNTASFPRRGESIEYDTSFVGWAKRSVPNALKASVPDVCQSTRLNCQTAKSDVPTSGFSGCWSHPCRVLPWLCCHDVEGGLFYDRCLVMDSRLRGNDGERFARMTGTHDCVVIDLSLPFPRRRIHGCHSRSS